MQVLVFDNCYLWPMSNTEVRLAFAQRLRSLEPLTKPFRQQATYREDEKLDPNVLPNSWPMSQFTTPLEPRAIYVAKSDEFFLGFLETKIHVRDYAKLLSCVVLPINNDAHDPVSVTRIMFQSFARDCVSMEVATITLPRNLSNYKQNEVYSAARYNFSTLSRDERVLHLVAACVAVCFHYPYLYFKSPFKTQYIFVTAANVQFLDQFVDLFLNGPIYRDLDVWRSYNVSLWRLETSEGTLDMLQPTEVDIVVEWQRKLISHQALELKDSKPIALFGKRIVLAPEHPDRVTVVACRRRQDIPPEALRVEDQIWAHAVAQLNHEEYKRQDMPFLPSSYQEDIVRQTQSVRRNAQDVQTLAQFKTQSRAHRGGAQQPPPHNNGRQRRRRQATRQQQQQIPSPQQQQQQQPTQHVEEFGDEPFFPQDFSNEEEFDQELSFPFF